MRELERAGVERVALLSSGAVPTASPGNAVAAYHRASEQALEATALGWTFLQPNSFMSNTLRWRDAIREDRPIVAPFADVAIATVDPRDVAAVAATALLTGDHAGHRLRITGPQALRPAEQARILGQALGRELAFEAQDDDAARAEMQASMPQAYVDAFFEFFVEGTSDETTVLPTVEEVTGRPPRDLHGWAAEHAPEFA